MPAPASESQSERARRTALTDFAADLARISLLSLLAMSASTTATLLISPRSFSICSVSMR